MVKTTIDIDDELWKKFSIKVIEEYGGRKKNDVIEALVQEFLADKQLVEALNEWMKEQEKEKTKKPKQ